MKREQCTLYTPGTLIIYNKPLGSALHRYLLSDLMQGNISKKAKSEQRNSLPCTNIVKETPRRITITSSLNEKSSNQLCKRVVGEGGITFHSSPFLQQASGQIFKDDVNGFFHLEYLLHGQYSLET